jgi:hypothetical protein
MSGIRPFFITGANAKVKVNDKTLAFCTDLSYSVQVITQTPKILGMYEGSSVEPLGYSVSGSFSVIRYAKDVKSNVGGKSPNGTAGNDAGNGVGNWGSAWGSGLGSFLARNGVGNDGRANEALDPSKFSNGVSFDIQVYQKTPSGDIGVANIRNVRITQADFQLTKKGAAVQKFNFVALYVDEDSFAADFSGQGQHFQG